MVYFPDMKQYKPTPESIKKTALPILQSLISTGHFTRPPQLGDNFDLAIHSAIPSWSDVFDGQTEIEDMRDCPSVVVIAVQLSHFLHYASEAHSDLAKDGALYPGPLGEPKNSNSCN